MITAEKITSEGKNGIQVTMEGTVYDILLDTKAILRNLLENIQNNIDDDEDKMTVMEDLRDIFFEALNKANSDIRELQHDEKRMKKMMCKAIKDMAEREDVDVSQIVDLLRKNQEEQPND